MNSNQQSSNKKSNSQINTLSQTKTTLNNKTTSFEQIEQLKFDFYETSESLKDFLNNQIKDKSIANEIL